jgi:tetratricopeptide (TPR) repeat protein
MGHLTSPNHLLSFVLLLALPETGVPQDLILLKNGNQISGRIAEEKDGCLEVLLPGGRVRLEAASVREIDRSRPFERYVAYGKGLLAKKDYRQAEQVYLEGIGAFGGDPTKKAPLMAGLVECGRSFLQERCYEDSRRVLGRVVELEPGHVEGQEQLAAAERMCRKIRKEISGFLHILEKDPDNDFARYHVGLRYESLGETEKARAEYERILKRYPVDLKEFNGEVHRLRGFIGRHLVVEEVTLAPAGRKGETAASSKEFRRLKSARTIIYHYDPKLAAEAARIADELIPALEKEFDIPADDRPYLIFIYQTNEEYNDATGKEGTTGYTEGARKVHLYQTEPGLLDTVLPHELTHSTLYRRYTGLPSWLDEGLAGRNERGHGVYYDRVKLWLAEGKALPFDQLLKKDVIRLAPDERKVFYGQACTLADFLYQEYGGQKKMLELLKAFAGNASAGNTGAGRKDTETALKAAYGFSQLSELETLWRKYMEL